jgi:hypothetical protein
MAMTPQQARARALQLRSLQPELQSVAIDDLIAQVMATEGMGAPGAGSGGLADLFPPKTLSAASPAPMAAARFQAAKPTAAIIPAAGAGTDAFRRAKEVRERTDQGPTVGERTAANARVDELIAELPKASGPRPPEVVPVREASPVAAAMAAAEAPAKATYRSRFRPQLEQAQAELEQLKGTIPAISETPPELASKITNLSGVVTRLQGLVSAEEGAVVDTDRAALLERQTARLGREEELVEQARKRAPFDALIAGGVALGSARPGESFTSALTRGLAAGNESYTGARDAREKSLRGIEEKRDTYTLQKIDAIQAARDKAIALQDAGVQLSKDEYALANLRNEDIVKLATREDVISEAKSKASKAKTEADTALETINTENDYKRAQAAYYRLGGRSAGVGVDKPMTANQVQTKIGDLNKERRGLMIELNSPTTQGAEKAAVKLAIQYIDIELGELKGSRSSSGTAKPAGRIISSKPIK